MTEGATGKHHPAWAAPEQRPPAGATCADCTHVDRCTAFGPTATTFARQPNARRLCSKSAALHSVAAAVTGRINVDYAV